MKYLLCVSDEMPHGIKAETWRVSHSAGHIPMMQTEFIVCGQGRVWTEEGMGQTCYLLHP